jgi:nitrogen fixation NifU-like protein
MTEAVMGKTVEEAEAIFRSFQEMVTGEMDEGAEHDLGDLEVLAGVKAYPVRIKCATLPWHTFHAALMSQAEPVTTE